MILLPLTRIQYTALRSIVLDHTRKCHDVNSDLTTSWIEVVSGAEVSIDEILNLVMQADPDTRYLVDAARREGGVAPLPTH